MKITNLECPSCGGRLKPMDGNDRIMICEYCNSQFVVEDDRTINYHIHQYAPGQLREIHEQGSKKNPLAIGIAIVAFLIVLGTTRGMLQMSASRTGTERPSLVTPEMEKEVDNDIDWEVIEDVPVTEVGHSPLYEAIVTSVFGKDAKNVTEEELSTLTYLRVSQEMEFSKIEYSFQNPYEDAEFETSVLELPLLSWESRDLNAFKGLQKLDICGEQEEAIDFEAFSNLKGLVTDGLNPLEIATLLPEPDKLIELSLDRPENLENISAFSNLKMLTIKKIYVPDVTQLVPLQSLIFLSIEEREQDGASLTDYAALSTLSQLSDLEISSSAIRDLSFLKALTNLHSLSVLESDAISIESIGELTQLTSLTLADNDAVQDYSPITKLTGLQKLSLDKSTSQPDPDLSSLGQLESLDMCGFMSVSFLNGMGGLKQLSIHGCNIDEARMMSGLTGLENLTCYANWTYAVPLKDVSFIDSMTNLKSVDFSGGSDDFWGAYEFNTEILGDISNVFNHPGLEKLILNNCMFEIAFDRLTENPSLKRLEMKEVNLKENFYVETYNGMTDIWYDDVSFDEHVDFLTKYPSLERLCLDGNQLTGIGFAAGLPKLRYLSLNNNYVTELSALHQVEDLKYLDIRMNPITSTIENDESIVILK